MVFVYIFSRFIPLKKQKIITNSALKSDGKGYILSTGEISRWHFFKAFRHLNLLRAEGFLYWRVAKGYSTRWRNLTRLKRFFQCFDPNHIIHTFHKKNSCILELESAGTHTFFFSVVQLAGIRHVVVMIVNPFKVSDPTTVNVICTHPDTLGLI